MPRRPSPWRAALRVAGRAADLAQLAIARAVVAPMFDGLEALAPGAVRTASPEPCANAGRSFIASATAAQKAVFVLKILATYGLGRPAALEAIEHRLGEGRRPARDRAARATEIIFLGDLLFHEGLGRGSLSEGLRARLKRADGLVINLEGTIGEPASELYPFQSLRGLRQLSAWNSTQDASGWVSRFDESKLRAFLEGLPPVVFGLANNHVLDDGREGLESTLRALERLGAAHVGLRDRGARVIEIGGARIAIIALNFGHNHAAEVDCNLLFAGVPYALPLPALRAEIARAREVGCDLLVASLHWGYEHEHLPRDDQLACVEALWELGFHAVIGHHPHVVQPSVGRGDRFASFSLGDFLGGDCSIFGRFSYAVSFRLSAGGARDANAEVEVIPLVQAPYYAERHRACLLHEAPWLERRVWEAVHRPKLRSV